MEKYWLNLIVGEGKLGHIFLATLPIFLKKCMLYASGKKIRYLYFRGKYGALLLQKNRRQRPVAMEISSRVAGGAGGAIPHLQAKLTLHAFIIRCWLATRTQGQCFTAYSQFRKKVGRVWKTQFGKLKGVTSCLLKTPSAVNYSWKTYPYTIGNVYKWHTLSLEKYVHIFPVIST